MNQVRTSRIEELNRPAWTLEANLYVPINDKDVSFGFPTFGPDNYVAVMKQALDNGQKLPTGEQTAFMLDEVYNSTNPDVKNSPRTNFVINNIMNPRWLWVPSINIWTPKDAKNPGMYAVFDEAGKGLTEKVDRSELEDRLFKADTERGVRFSQDRKVAFAPLNTIRPEYHEKGTLAQDGAYIAVYGIDGAEKLDKVASFFRGKPYSWIVNNTTDQPIQRLSALYRVKNGLLGGGGLGTGFDTVGYGGDGYVVSVSGSGISAEGTAPNLEVRPEIPVFPGCHHTP